MIHSGRLIDSVSFVRSFSRRRGYNNVGSAMPFREIPFKGQMVVTTAIASTVFGFGIFLGTQAQLFPGSIKSDKWFHFPSSCFGDDLDHGKMKWPDVPNHSEDPCKGSYDCHPCNRLQGASVLQYWGVTSCTRSKPSCAGVCNAGRTCCR